MKAKYRKFVAQNDEEVCRTNVQQFLDEIGPKAFIGFTMIDAGIVVWYWDEFEKKIRNDFDRGSKIREDIPTFLPPRKGEVMCGIK